MYLALFDFGAPSLENRRSQKGQADSPRKDLQEGLKMVDLPHFPDLLTRR